MSASRGLAPIKARCCAHTHAYISVHTFAHALTFTRMFSLAHTFTHIHAFVAKRLPAPAVPKLDLSRLLAHQALPVSGEAPQAGVDLQHTAGTGPSATPSRSARLDSPHSLFAQDAEKVRACTGCVHIHTRLRTHACTHACTARPAWAVKACSHHICTRTADSAGCKAGGEEAACLCALIGEQR